MKPDNDPARCAIEDFPHLVRKINLVWGNEELEILIDGLMMDARNGKRKGFPMEAGTELVFLAECNKVRRAIDFAERAKIDVNTAFKTIEAGEQARRAKSVWDDPMSTGKLGHRIEGGTAQPLEHRSREKSASVASGFGYWVFRIVTSKAFVILIAIALILKFASKFIQPSHLN